MFFTFSIQFDSIHLEANHVVSRIADYSMMDDDCKHFDEFFCTIYMILRLQLFFWTLRRRLRSFWKLVTDKSKRSNRKWTLRLFLKRSTNCWSPYRRTISISKRNRGQSQRPLQQFRRLTTSAPSLN